jgi:hypothetical protein
MVGRLGADWGGGRRALRGAGAGGWSHGVGLDSIGRAGSRRWRSARLRSVLRGRSRGRGGRCGRRWCSALAGGSRVRRKTCPADVRNPLGGCAVVSVAGRRRGGRRGGQAQWSVHWRWAAALVRGSWMWWESGSADVAQPARSGQRVGVDAVVAGPLEGAGAVHQGTRSEPAPLRAPAEARSSAAECEPPAGRRAGRARDGKPARARRWRGAAQVPRPGLQSRQLVQPRSVRRAVFRRRQLVRRAMPRGRQLGSRPLTGQTEWEHGERRGTEDRGQQSRGDERRGVVEELEQDSRAEQQKGRGEERPVGTGPRPCDRGDLQRWPAPGWRTWVRCGRP